MAILVTTTVGGREVVASGSVLARGEEPVVFKVSDLSYRIEFEKTESKKLGVVADLAGDDKVLVLRLQNFDDAIGASYFAAVGELSGRPLNVDLSVHTIWDGKFKQRLLSYCFTLGEAKNG